MLAVANARQRKLLATTSITARAFTRPAMNMTESTGSVMTIIDMQYVGTVVSSVDFQFYELTIGRVGQ